MHFSTLLNDTLESVTEHAADLGIDHDLLYIRTIRERGTSAHLQLELFHRLTKEVMRWRTAMQDVAKWLRSSTEAGPLPNLT